MLLFKTRSFTACELLELGKKAVPNMNVKILAVTILMVSVNQAKALTTATKYLAYYETKANAVSTRDNTAIPMPHFEIPLNMLELDFAKRLSPAIRDQLVFQKGNQTFVRWILNPEDTVWFTNVQMYFLKKGLKLEKQYYFTGYKTASRSYLVEDPDKKVQFSVKSSTNVTGGNWASKQQPVGEAIDSRLNADFLMEMQNKLKFKNFVFLDEPAIIKLPQVDQAVVIRDLADLNNEESGKMYIPGFSVLHEEIGKRIAMVNGSNNPEKYWTENYIKPVGRALGELAARTGMQFDSPHSQNFLVEVDKGLKPTGRIIFRDMADLYIHKDLMTVLNSDAKNYFKNFSQKENILKDINAGFGPLHGNQSPTWVNWTQYASWKDVFFNEFEKEFATVSGLQIEDFKSTYGLLNEKYFGNTYTISKKSKSAKLFWNNMTQMQSPQGILNCAYLFR